jgi:alkane 1-monooxygenase
LFFDHRHAKLILMQALTSRPISVTLFALASTAPLVLLALAALAGGVWVWAALIYMGVLPVLIDRLAPIVPPDAPDAPEFPGSDALSVVIALGGIGMMVLGVYAIARADWPAGLGLFVAIGFWLGQVVHPAAHELIHRADRRLFRLGVATCW